ncbi:MAG TPA: hypothetical protein DDZ42_19010 [Candidatus Rokubacteria bacterium]|nr:MAG: hypothetical protein A2050_02000 [Candidatus Rokubacteria bacterium GWA2_73_35]HBH03972.1 hypothetical protein [Candidatus Rokubacteria bacterium]
MGRRLLAVNVLLAGVSLLSIAYIARELVLAPPPIAAQLPRPAAAPAAPPAPADARVAPPAGAYATIASRNLFSPTRSETAAGAAAGPAFAKPTLYGVVLRNGAPIAYLEDPATKRTAGYRIGDRIGGGTVQAINADQVVLASPAGEISVRLRDPSKPRAPVPSAAQPGIPGRPTAAPPGTPQPTTPGVLIPPRTLPMPGLTTPGLPGARSPLLAPGVRQMPGLGTRFPIPRAQDAPRP